MYINRAAAQTGFLWFNGQCPSVGGWWVGGCRPSESQTDVQLFRKVDMLPTWYEVMLYLARYPPAPLRLKFMKDRCPPIPTHGIDITIVYR